MRGSIYYQTSLLAKAVFSEGATKEAKTNPDSVEFNMVSSFTTMETYRRLWNNLGLYVKEEFGIRDFERISSAHIESYMLQKADISPSKQYLEKISSALGKLAVAIEMFRHAIGRPYLEYDFSVRQKVLDAYREQELVYDGYHDRAYEAPEVLIDCLKEGKHKLAAKMQNCSGARFEGIGLIKRSQKVERGVDSVTNREVYLLETKEKGGKVGSISLSPELYSELQYYLLKEGEFRIDYQQYARAIRTTCTTLNINPEGSHGFRWSFAQRRICEYQEYGYSYLEALQGVSYEMKHNRIKISEHYIG